MFRRLKNRIYRKLVPAIEEPRSAIIRAVHSIAVQQLIIILKNMERSVDACINDHGEHFDHSL